MERSTPRLTTKRSTKGSEQVVEVVINSDSPFAGRIVTVEWRDAAGELHREVLSAAKSRPCRLS
ncbi:MAG: hypothetical protein R2817_06635 [Flavobacteriales bacterium]